jgi:hypothetical protein
MGKSNMMIPADPEIIEIDNISAELDISGNLALPLFLNGTRRVSLGNIRHLNAEMGPTTMRLNFKNVPDLTNRPYPGLCFCYCYGGDYAEVYGFLAPAEMTNGQKFVFFAVTDLGVFVHEAHHIGNNPAEDFKTYYPTYVHDYINMYDFTAFNEPVPFGDVEEVWTIDIKRTVVGLTSEIETVFTGSNHPGKRYVALVIVNDLFMRNGEQVIDSSIGYGMMNDSDFKNYPTNLQVLSGSLILNNRTGVLPVITTFTPDAIAGRTINEGGYDIGIVSLVVNEPVSGYYFTADANIPPPLPLPGVYAPTLNPPIPVWATSHFEGANLITNVGAKTVYLYVVNATNDVSLRASASVFLPEVMLDGKFQFGANPNLKTNSTLADGEHTYTVGQTAIGAGGVLSMITPHVGEAVTYTLTPTPGGGATNNNLFEIVNGILKFKAAAVDNDQHTYTVHVTATDESLLEVSSLFAIYLAT